MKVESVINPDALDFNAVLEKVADDVVNEIKNLVSSGKNTNNESLAPKKNGDNPDLINLLDTLEYKMVADGFEILIGDNSKMVAVSYISLRWNWTIFHPSDYLDKFITKKLDEYLQEQFDNL